MRPLQLVTAQSTRAQAALSLFEKLQELFAEGINQLSERYADGARLQATSWLRDEGRHGGGWRFEGTDLGILNRGSLNISNVHYDDLPEKRLASATALSCIVHPQDPRASSLHTHLSWTELRDGSGGWRFMADLNPSIVIESQRDRFISDVEQSLSELSAEQRKHARAQGDRYFWIPTLDRHRGVAHFYLEQYHSGDFEADLALATRFGQRVIEVYLDLVNASLSREEAPSPEDYAAQLEYHSAYFLQVLTLDRGTSSGLLVHQQNDVGIMGSLPQRVDRDCLQRWVARQPEPQGELLEQLIAVLPEAHPSSLSVEVRAQLAEVVRQHYRRHPDALKLQARGDILPPTVAHHTQHRSS